MGEPPVIRHVLRRELRAHRRGFLLWSVPVAALLVLVASLQASMAGDGGVLAAKLQAMPAAMRRALGMGAVDLTRPASYLSINFVYVTLTAALYGATLGASILAREESQRTAELLYVRPVTRVRILVGKALATAIYVVGFNLGLAAVALGAFAVAGPTPLEIGLILAMFGGTAVLGGCFAGVGLLVAAVSRRPRGAPGLALGITLGAYLLQVATAAAPAAAWLGAVSPFRHVEPGRIVAAGGLDPVVATVLVAAGVAAGTVAAWRYRGRDLAA